ncbi:MAG: YraN family protein [Anaerolineae bacterium]|nr:MAG: YraN family protein [Anaerolineae bacterium]
MITSRKALGRLGEELAARALAAQGYRIRERNWRCPDGELDIVAEDGDVLAFVEVKTRRGREFGTPEEAVTPAKQAKLVELAATYVQESDWPGDWRIDVAAVELTPNGKLIRLEIIKNAVGEW